MSYATLRVLVAALVELVLGIISNACSAPVVATCTAGCPQGTVCDVATDLCIAAPDA
jgi:hypothetical protein